MGLEVGVGGLGGCCENIIFHRGEFNRCRHLCVQYISCGDGGDEQDKIKCFPEVDKYSASGS